MAKGSISSFDQDFYIDGYAVSGVNSLNGGYSIQSDQTTFLGNRGRVSAFQTAPAIGKFQVSREMTSQPSGITKWLGEEGFSGLFKYGDKALAFQSGFMTSYRASFAVDDLPSEQFAIDVYGEMGGDFSVGGLKKKNEEVFIPSSSGIQIECKGRKTNRVNNFEYQVSVSREPHYAIGSEHPKQVSSILPNNISLSLNLTIDDYETENIYTSIRDGIDLTGIKIIVANKCNPSKNIEYKIEDAHLVSETIGGHANNSVSVNLQYQAASMNPPEISYNV
tara:strand:- start:108 stop:941 length:834 start_codon:yes stop_codon:yes gene_type:complete